MNLTSHRKLAGKTVEELLYLVGDEAKGGRAAALETLLGKDFNAIYRSLEKALRNNEEADLRNAAMEVMVQFGSRSVPRLLSLLEDEDEEIRNFSTVMLGYIASPAATEGLIEALRDPDINVRQGAAEALSRIKDPRALEPLVGLLHDDFWLQYSAVTALGEIRDSRAVPHLIDAVANEMLTEAAMEALAKIGDSRAFPVLGAVLERADARLNGAAARALFALKSTLAPHLCGRPVGDELREAVSDQGRQRLHALLTPQTERQTAEAAIALLGELGDLSALPPFLDLLEHHDYLPAMETAVVAMGGEAAKHLEEALSRKNDRARILAVRGLRSLGVSSPEGIVPLLYVENEELQIEALATLDGTKDPHLMPRFTAMLRQAGPSLLPALTAVIAQYPWQVQSNYLLPLMKSPEPLLRQRVLAVLAKNRDAVPFSLFSPLLEDPVPEVRREALKLAGVRKMGEALPCLVQALHDGCEEIRIEAVSALAEFDDPSVPNFLAPLLAKGPEPLQYAVIMALAKIGGSNAATRVIPFLHKDSPSGRLTFAAIEALKKLGDRESRQALAECLKHPDSDIRREAVHALAHLGCEGLAEAAKALSDSHWSVRLAAVQVLGVRGNAKGVKLLARALEDEDPLVVKGAIASLGATGSVAAVPHLLSVLTGHEDCAAAFGAFVALGTKGVPRLHRVMEEPHPLTLKERVVEILGRIGDRRSIPLLLRVLEEGVPELKRQAVAAAVQMKDPLVMEKVLHLATEDSDDEVRRHAQSALRPIAAEHSG